MPRTLLSDEMRRRGVRRRSAGVCREGDDCDDQSSASESRNMLTVPVDDWDNATDCEELYDEESDGHQRRSRHHSLCGSQDNRNGEYLTDIEMSDDDDEHKSSPSQTETQVTRRTRRELAFYIQRVLGRPLRAVTCFKECEHGGTIIQSEHVDEGDEITDDESSACNQTTCDNDAGYHEESPPVSQVSNFEASDIEDDFEMDQTDSNNNRNGQENMIDNYLQGHFARLSTTDHDSRYYNDIEVDESHPTLGITVSNYGENSSDVSHPVTEEELLSEREVNHRSINRTKRRATRGQFTKQSNYLTTSLPPLGQSETDSESEADGCQLIRSPFKQFKSPGESNFRSNNQMAISKEQISNLPSTDSESFDLED